MLLHAQVYHQPAYFNRNCFCTIPECWKAELVEDVQEVLGRSSFSFCDPQGVGHTREEAVASLIDALKAAGITGHKLRLC